MSRAVIDAIFRDYEIERVSPDESEITKFRKSREKTLFKVGDRVRISRGLKWLRNPPHDTKTDGSLGLFGTVVSFFESPDMRLYKIPTFEERDYDSILHLWIKLLPYEKKDNMWYPSNEDEGAISKVKSPDNEDDILVQAMDLVNYTVLGDIKGNLLFEQTKDRELDLLTNVKKNPWPKEWHYSLWLTADSETKYCLEVTRNHIIDHAMIHYSDIFDRFVSLGRKQRWRVHYIMLNGYHPVAVDNDDEVSYDGKDIGNELEEMKCRKTSEP